MTIEQDLQRALRRKPGPDDLADRALARVAAGEQPTSARSPSPASARSASAGSRRSSSISSIATSGGGRHSAGRWLAAAAAIVLVATGGARYYADRQAAAEAERVKEEIRLALQITSETLAHVQRRVETSLDRRLPGGSPDHQDRQDTP